VNDLDSAFWFGAAECNSNMQTPELKCLDCCRYMRRHCKAQGSCILTRAGRHERGRSPWKAPEYPGCNAVDDIDAASFRDAACFRDPTPRPSPHPPSPCRCRCQGRHHSRRVLRNLSVSTESGRNREKFAFPPPPISQRLG
jgi:hypothetical protein